LARFAPSIALLLAALASGVSTAAEPESARGPDVTIVLGEDRTAYEYRQAGQLRMIKIVPKHGLPYYLVPADPTRGFGDLEQADMLIPRWTIIEF
jgi:Protein of unknown function (DUF2782)